MLAIGTQMDLTDEEKRQIAYLIDGELTEATREFDYDHPDIKFWIHILRKLGPAAEPTVNNWCQIAREEAGIEL